jgi:hypothetical protein
MSIAPVSERAPGVAGLQCQRTSRIWLGSDERRDCERRPASARGCPAPPVSLVRAHLRWELIATDAVIARGSAT